MTSPSSSMSNLAGLSSCVCVCVCVCVCACACVRACACVGVSIWRLFQVSKGRPSVAFKVHRTLFCLRPVWLDLQQQSDTRGKTNTRSGSFQMTICLLMLCLSCQLKRVVSAYVYLLGVGDSFGSHRWLLVLLDLLTVLIENSHVLFVRFL